MAVKYDLMVANGSYQKDGQDKTSWLKMGVVMQTKKGGFVAKIDCIPTHCTNQNGDTVAWDGWAQMFEPRAKQEKAPETQKPADSGFDDIPF